MKEFKVNGMGEGNPKPTQLEFLSYLKYRSPQLFAGNEKIYNSLTTAYLGERAVIHHFTEHGQKHWRYIRNYWADVNGSFESDLMVVTNHACYTFEIKHYTGVFEYRDGISTVDGIDYHSDCIFQARRAFKNIRKILSPQIGFQNMKGGLIFSSPDNETKIHSPVDDIQILQRNQLVRYIQNIAEAENALRYERVDWERIIPVLEKFQIANPYSLDALTVEQVTSLRKGIACGNCSNFQVQITRKFVKCNCGYLELREQAVVRTILEYGALRYDNHLRRKDLYEFLDGQVSIRKLSLLLDKHFERVSNGKYTYYRNNRR